MAMGRSVPRNPAIAAASPTGRDAVDVDVDVEVDAEGGVGLADPTVRS
jgi:hypothetical protein